MDHREFDIMIEPIEGQVHKKNFSNCAQAEKIFAVLDDQQLYYEASSGKNLGVAGIIKLPQSEVDSLPATLSLFCKEFRKQFHAVVGHPNHIVIFAGTVTDLGENATEVLQSRIHDWESLHRYKNDGKHTQKLLVLFQDRTNLQATSSAESAAGSLDIFFTSVSSEIDEKELRLVLTHKVQEILHKLVLDGVQLLPAMGIQA